MPYSVSKNLRSHINSDKKKLFVFLDHQVSIELDNGFRRNKYRRVRNRWHLLLTLHNNPSLQEHRRPDLFIQKSPLVALQVMIRKGIVQYNQCEGENDDKSGIEDDKLWLQCKPQFKLQSTGVYTDGKRCFDSSHRQCRHHFRPGGTSYLDKRYFKVNYYVLFSYMASSVSGQDEPNPALWLATRAGNMELSWPARDYPLCPARKISPKAI